MSALLDAKLLLRRYITVATYPHSPSFAAYGEDCVAVGWIKSLSGLGWPEVRYLDIGACHPTRLSNTFSLYSRGASGVLVEPNPDLIAALERRRPRDTVICAGVAFDHRRTAELHRFADPVFNSFATKNSSNSPYLDSVTVPLLPMNDILQKHFPSRSPELLSIDAEGADFAILKSIDFDSHKPLVICIETSNGFQEYENHLSPYGYRFICRTPDNALYARTAS